MDRFWAKLKLNESNGCLEWRGSISTNGYGYITFHGKQQLTHRVAWLLTHGDVPKGGHILHKCDNPCCCNPAHLFLGTHADNMRDKAIKGRVNTTKLNVEQVLKIRKLDLSIKEIAAMYGVDRSTISLIRRRKTWRHVS